MTAPHTPAITCRSRLSFQPLLARWAAIAAGHSMQARMCAHLIRRFSQYPELLQPLDDVSILAQHADLIDEGMATIFPVALHVSTDQLAAAVPFSQKIIYASPFFKQRYVENNTVDFTKLNAQIERTIYSAQINLAYKLILKKYYDIDLPGGHSFVCAFPNAEQDIHHYFELEWDTQFVEVSTSEPLPGLPNAITTTCHHTNDLVQHPELLTVLPLEHFLFEGLLIIRIYEVTEREATMAIKALLENGNLFEEASLLNELQQQVRYFLQMPQVAIGVTSYPVQDPSLLPANNSSLLLPHIAPAEQAAFCQLVAKELQQASHYRFTNTAADRTNLLNQYLAGTPPQHLLLLPLTDGNELVGWLEIGAADPIPIHMGIVDKLQRIIDLLEVVVLKHQQVVQDRIDKIIKEHFTAVQSTVEWKFREAAFTYLTRGNNAGAKMDPIQFEGVYPLYGIVDIRNSSVERNKAIQLDLLQQLQWLQELITAAPRLSSPGWQEAVEKSKEYSYRVNHFLFAADEHLIVSFLRGEAENVVKEIKQVHPSLSTAVDAYLTATDNRRHMLITHQHLYEESVTAINTMVTRLLKKEQQAAQAIYPHYFEHFVTDGVDFNMYIGQSIAPALPFHTACLPELRLWQLRVLALAARLVYHHEASLPLSLETTQLLLVYSDALSIRFRTEERKFDVDGVYNVRYEVVKKRIDKAVIKGTGERLTQPHTIAIVYTGESEAAAYLEYINYLKMQELLKGEVEWLELDELQGVNGLKALRIAVNLPVVATAAKRKSVQLTNTLH